MDDELEALMASFTQAQQVKSSIRLSERNVIELVSWLKHNFSETGRIFCFILC
jgi:predicted nucleic-acid-binding protein